MGRKKKPDTRPLSQREGSSEFFVKHFGMSKDLADQRSLEISKFKKLEGPRVGARNPEYWRRRGFNETESTFLANAKFAGRPEYYLFYDKTSDYETAKSLAFEHNQSRKQTKSNMISRYGKSEGLKKWELYKSRQGYTNTLDYYIDKFGKEDGPLKYQENVNSRKVTLDNMVLKYGEVDGLLRWNAYKERQRYTTTLDYFVETYGPVEGKLKFEHFDRCRPRTLDSYIYQYGEELGTQKFEEYLKNKKTPWSKISQELFDTVSKFCILSDVYYATNQHEWFVNESGLPTIFLDFFHRPSGVAVEFFGDIWHGNPKIFKSGDTIKLPSGEHKLVDTLWRADKNRLYRINQQEYISEVFVVWESDFRSDPTKIVEQIVNKINGSN